MLGNLKQKEAKESQHAYENADCVFWTHALTSLNSLNEGLLRCCIDLGVR